MKTKFSALTLAMLPFLASANTNHAITPNNDLSYDPSSVIVVYKKDANRFEKASARRLVTAKISDVNFDEIDDRFQNVLSGRLAKYTLNKQLTTKQAIARLSKHPAVLYAEPDYQVHAIGTPDDTYFEHLWGMHNTGQTEGKFDADIDAPEAWDISTGSKDIVVGIIDTGIDYTHPDLAANMWVNPNEIPGDGIDNDNNGYIDDIHGINAITDSGDPMDVESHGTHVAGTIGASGNNANGVVGVSQQVSMIGCKFLGVGGGSISDAIKCMDYMIGLKNSGTDIRILNNSWGGGGFSQAMSDAIDSSEQADMLFVAAAGNGAVDNDHSPFFPSSYEHDSVLSIASTDHHDKLSSFSQWGLNSVDMAAPGSAILSTIPGNGYDSFDGTSMATPHVAGVAALALSVNPGLSNLELKSLLMQSGDAIDALQGITVSGKRLNALAALEEANPEPSFRLKVTPAAQEITAGATATYTFEVASIAEWDGTVELDLESTLTGATLSTHTAKPGDTITLTVPTTNETIWGDYTFTVNATSDTLNKTVNTNLFVYPQNLKEFTYHNESNLVVPDGDPNGVTSVINVPDDITTFNTATHLNITHQFIGDLIIKLTSPSGTTTTIRNKGGAPSGPDAIFDQVIDSSAFAGEVARGDWVLSLEDTFPADEGVLNHWSLTFTGIGEVAPQAPVSEFTFERDLLTVNFTNQSTDINDDIASYHWDFGDGNSTTDTHPVHNYQTPGTYSVTLTTVDEQGQSHAFTQQITVSDINIELAVKRANLSRTGFLRVEMTFDNANEQTLNVYRNGELVDTTENTGIYRSFERGIEARHFTYKICQSGDICSNEVTIDFE